MSQDVSRAGGGLSIVVWMSDNNDNRGASSRAWGGRIRRLIRPAPTRLAAEKFQLAKSRNSSRSNLPSRAEILQDQFLGFQYQTPAMLLPPCLPSIT